MSSYIASVNHLGWQWLFYELKRNGYVFKDIQLEMKTDKVVKLNPVPKSAFELLYKNEPYKAIDLEIRWTLRYLDEDKNTRENALRDSYIRRDPEAQGSTVHRTLMAALSISELLSRPVYINELSQISKQILNNGTLSERYPAELHAPIKSLLEGFFVEPSPKLIPNFSKFNNFRIAQLMRNFSTDSERLEIDNWNLDFGQDIPTGFEHLIQYDYNGNPQPTFVQYKKVQINPFDFTNLEKYTSADVWAGICKSVRQVMANADTKNTNLRILRDGLIVDGAVDSDRVQKLLQGVGNQYKMFVLFAIGLYQFHKKVKVSEEVKHVTHFIRTDRIHEIYTQEELNKPKTKTKVEEMKLLHPEWDEERVHMELAEEKRKKNSERMKKSRLDKRQAQVNTD